MGVRVPPCAPFRTVVKFGILFISDFHQENFQSSFLFLKKLNQKGIIYIFSTKNNTLITLTDLDGNTKFSTSAGMLGFKNSRKSTTYAAQAAADVAAAQAAADAAAVQAAADAAAAQGAADEIGRAHV